MDRRKLSTVYYENFEKEPIVKLKRRTTELGLVPINPVSSDVLIETNNGVQSVEEKLIKTGSWALFCIRLPGYFPIATKSTKDGLQLQLSCCSLVTFYTTIATVISVLGSLLFYSTFAAKFLFVPPSNLTIDPKLHCPPPPPAPTYGNVASFVWTSFIILVTYTTYLRCSRIFYISGSLKFWKNCVSMFENLIDVGYSLNDSYFSEISSTIRKHILKLFMVGFCKLAHTLFVNIPDLLAFGCMDLIEYNTVILETFLCFILFFHIGYSVWLTYWIKLFVMAFQTVHDDLDGIEDEDEDSGAIGNGSSNPIPNPTETTKLHENRTIEYKIRRTLSAYGLIEEHMHEFNSFFGVTIIFETLFTVTLLIVNVYCAFTYFDGKVDDYMGRTYAIFGMICPCGMYLLALLELNSESSILSGKSTATLKKLDTFFIPSANRPELQILQMKVLALIARVADNPPMISAGHFFSINRHLLTSILGTVTTYLIVLLQFRGTNEEAKSTTTTTELPGLTTTISSLS